MGGGEEGGGKEKRGRGSPMSVGSGVSQEGTSGYAEAISQAQTSQNSNRETSSLRQQCRVGKQHHQTGGGSEWL